MTELTAEDLRDLSHHGFEPWIGSTFRTHAEEAEISLELVAVVAPPVDEFHLAARQRAGIRLQPFNLHFRGPRDGRFAQGTRRLGHPHFGVLDIFLVPIGADSSGQLYEAVFN